MPQAPATAPQTAARVHQPPGDPRMAPGSPQRVQDGTPARLARHSGFAEELMQRSPLLQRSQLARDLDLTREQRTEIAELRKQQRAEVTGIQRNRDLSPEERREQVQQVIHRIDDQVCDVLDAEQLRKLNQIRGTQE